MSESCANRCVRGARRRPHVASPYPARLRLSRIFRRSDTPGDPDAVPLRRALMWGLVALVLVVGVVLYFKYARLVVPILS